MSNYTIQVAWSGKDALADSDVNKVISGTDFDTEFTAVRDSVNSKAELAGSVTQAFSATTAVSGTNTTQVATTAFVQAATPTAAVINALVYPVGSIYTSVVATNPATLLSMGTWVAFGTGKTLVGLDSTDTDFDTVEETGGSKTHTLTEAQMPVHDHTNNLRVEANAATMVDASKLYTAASGNMLDHITSDGTTSTYTGDAGSGDAHPIVQPYITVYFWKRTV